MLQFPVLLYFETRRPGSFQTAQDFITQLVRRLGIPKTSLAKSSTADGSVIWWWGRGIGRMETAVASSLMLFMGIEFVLV
jgi:hypothetical protein